MHVGLRHKIIFGIMGLLALTVFTIDYAVENITSDYLEREFHKRAVFSAMGISERAGEFLSAKKDLPGLQMELLGFQRVTPDVKYIFVRSLPGTGIIASTPDLPEEVEKFPAESAEDPYRVQSVTIAKEKMVDVTVPIEDGELGFVHMGMSEETLHAAIKGTSRVIVAVSCGIVLLGGILAAVMVRVLTKPIPELIRVSDAVGQGDLEHQVTVSTTDEMGALGKAINRMIEGLRASRSELQEAKDYTDKIIRSMGDVLVVLGMDAKIKTVSASAERVFGHRAEDLVGQSIGTLYMDGDTAFRSNVLDKIERGDKVQDLLFVGRTSDGGSIPMSLSAAPMRNADGLMIGLVCIARDRTEIENLLYEVDQIYNGSLSAMRVVDPKFNIISANNAFCQMAGLPKEQIKGRKCYEVFASECCRTERCNLAQILRGKSRLDIEDERTCVDGHRVATRVLATPFRDSSGKTAGIIEVFADISEQKKLIGELEHKTSELEKAYETQRAYASIVAAFNSPAEFEIFLSNGLSQIAGHVNAQAGVLYLHDAGTNRLVPAAVYALDRSTIAQGFVLGEGLPGQAALEQKVLSVQNVPPEYFHIVSGITDGLPQHVICVPVTFGQQVIGVLELATCHVFTESNLDLLKIVSAQLGVSIHEAQMHIKTEQLAEDLRDKNDLLAAQNEELRSQSDELVAMNEELQSQTKELATQKKILEKTTRQAQEADQMKSEFLSNMSHELRTPLNAILGMAALMNSGDFVNPRHESYLKIIERNGQNLLQLINDILDLSKIESGHLEMAFAEVPLREFMEDTIVSIGTLAQERSLNLKVSVDADVESIICDPDKLRQVLTNLLSNAIKFTDEGGTVVLSTRDNGPDYVDIAVSDTGIGIPKASVASVFEAFRQLDGTVTRKHGGIGLGLSIVKKLTEALGGRIAVESEPGKGSTFTVTLPRRNEVREPLSPGIQSRIEDVRKAFYPGTHPRTEGKRSPNILIIDDDPMVSRELGNILRDEKYQLEFADNGRSGLEKVKEKRPDLILLDLKMPGMDGFSFIEQMVRDENLRGIPLLLVTAMDLSRTDRGRLKGANVSDIIFKGRDDTEAFLRKIKAALSTRLSAENVPAPAGVDGSSRKVLIVEDQPDNLFLFTEAMRPGGHTILTAVNGEEAVKVAERERPDLILMDIQMPVMDGYEAMRRIRSLPGLSAVPIIALTARAMRGDDKKALQEGYDDYLAKPISPFKVLQKVDEWLKRAERTG